MHEGKETDIQGCVILWK